MTAAEMIHKVRLCDRDFPPRTHCIEEVAVEGHMLTIRVVPKPGFTGEPKTYTVDTANPESDDPIMLGMMKAGHFTALYGKCC